MLIYPAIDLRGGQCVRLRQGDYNQETVFGRDPATMARRWVELGAEYLHLVDLDRARGRAGCDAGCRGSLYRLGLVWARGRYRLARVSRKAPRSIDFRGFPYLSSLNI